MEPAKLCETPEIGKRVSNRNGFDSKVIHDVPHLKIIEDDLWQSVKIRQRAIWKATEADVSMIKHRLLGPMSYNAHFVRVRILWPL